MKAAGFIFIPPEVELEGLVGSRRQKLAVRDNGEPFRQYLLCMYGCGFLIGCGDAVQEVGHLSCAARAGRDVRADA